ncbi:transglutaminase-like domain-containing protein [Actinacidiphila oryziradicis]|uniref:Transglutaminase domain-containing protein n=1 Tax=Actinacidiphila oryziradicis TaxID=2571141 RepID=A0A4U0STS8_9ACTN|nr:transglutaminase domain-containing protein [Actinacidiphila oryziradicis]TKA11881.1 transglutaminase domain-containing protein [Actinacidiphila oryziradicis]
MVSGQQTPRAEELDFHSAQSVFSAPGDGSFFAGLPTEPRELASIVRSLLIHREETELFGYRLPEDRRNEAETRYVCDILDAVRAMNDAPLTAVRHPQEQFAGTCRDFALLLCALLRNSGVPARIRCGFATYFVPGFHEDHWVTEYWQPGPGWKLIDAQMLAPETMEAYKISFDPTDVPRDRFLVAGDAWQACRTGRADRESFGVGVINFTGMWAVQGNVVRDLAALNRVEALPWDGWGLVETPYEELSGSETELLDTVAAATVRGGPFTELRRLFRENPGLRTPTSIRSHTTYGGERTVTLQLAESGRGARLEGGCARPVGGH